MLPELILPWDCVKGDFPAGVVKSIEAEYDRNSGFLPFEHGYVYIIEAVGTNYYKIGKTVNPDRRILQIAPQMPFPTRYVRVWSSLFMSLGEKLMHEYLEPYRANGEWFELNEVELLDILHERSALFASAIRYAYCKYFFQRCGIDPRAFCRYVELLHEEDFCMDPFGTTIGCFTWINSVYLEISEERFGNSSNCQDLVKAKAAQMMSRLEKQPFDNEEAL